MNSADLLHFDSYSMPPIPMGIQQQHVQYQSLNLVQGGPDVDLLCDSIPPPPSKMGGGPPTPPFPPSGCIGGPPPPGNAAPVNRARKNYIPPPQAPQSSSSLFDADLDNLMLEFEDVSPVAHISLGLSPYCNIHVSLHKS